MKSNIFGISTTNTRIESHWSRWLEQGGYEWIDRLGALKHDGYFQIDSIWSKELLIVLVLPLLKDFTREMVEVWNEHTIRKQKKLGGHIHVIPVSNYTRPPPPYEEQKHIVQESDIKIFEEDYIKGIEQLMKWMDDANWNKWNTVIQEYLKFNNIKGVDDDNWESIYRDIVKLCRRTII